MQRTIIHLTCDMPHVRTKTTGTGKSRKTEEIPESVEGKATHVVVLDGEPREIDVCEDHEKELLQVVGEVMAHGRKVAVPVPSATRRSPTRRTGSNSKGTSTTTPKTAIGEIRQWARNSGYEVADRGRVPAEIIEKYREAEAAGRVVRQQQPEEKSEQSEQSEQEPVNA